MSGKILLTEQGYKKLADELGELETTALPKSNERIKRARAFCDYYEDSEYKLALLEQKEIIERINELKNLLYQSAIIKKQTRKDKVRLGVMVELLDLSENTVTKHMIVSSKEITFFKDAISIESPLGRELLGKKVKDEITVHTPSGKREVKFNHID